MSKNKAKYANSVSLPTNTLLNQQFILILPSSRMVYIVMQTKLDGDSLLVKWKDEELADTSGMSRNTIRRGIKELHKIGYIEILEHGKRWNSGSTYKIIPNHLEPGSEHLRGKRTLDDLPTGNGSIYFVGNIEQGIVKIGYSGDNIDQRLSDLQTASAYDLSILKLITRTNIQGERIVQNYFNDYHMRGEWYKIDGELAKYLSI